MKKQFALSSCKNCLWRQISHDEISNLPFHHAKFAFGDKFRMMKNKFDFLSCKNCLDESCFQYDFDILVLFSTEATFIQDLSNCPPARARDTRHCTRNCLAPPWCAVHDPPIRRCRPAIVRIVAQIASLKAFVHGADGIDNQWRVVT